MGFVLCSVDTCNYDPLVSGILIDPLCIYCCKITTGIFASETVVGNCVSRLCVLFFSFAFLNL